MTAQLPSPPWTTPTKFLVALVALVLVGALLYRFQVILVPLVLAVMLAYLLKPVVEFLSRRTRLTWDWSVNLIFLTLIALIVAASTALGFVLQQQAEGLYGTVLEIVQDLPEQLAIWTAAPVTVGPFTFDLSHFDLEPLYAQLLGSARSLLGQTGTLITTFFSRAVNALMWLIFVLAVSYYLLHDFPRLGPGIDRMAMPGYSGDVHRLRRELAVIWHAFLRGQVVLGLVMGVTTAVVMTALGVRYSLVLGLLAGLTEFVPIIGPLLASAVAVLVALFQDGNWLGLSPWAYAGLVALAGFLLQQLENNFLVPRILGRSLNLHPVAIMIGAIIGASLAGILGLLLSAPTVASVKLLGRYAYGKMFDLPSFPAPPVAQSPGRRRDPWGSVGAFFRKLGGRDAEAADSPTAGVDAAQGPRDVGT